MSSPPCPACGSANTVREERTVTFKSRGQTLEIPNMVGWFCNDCGEAVLDDGYGESYFRQIEAFSNSISEHAFVLYISLPDPSEDGAKYLGALLETGCDDATVGTGNQGCIALDFLRVGATREAAIESAIGAVERAIPGAKVVVSG